MLTSIGAFPNAHAKPLSCQIDNCYSSPSISDSCVSLLNLHVFPFESLEYYTVLQQYYRTQRTIWCTNFDLQIASNEQVTVRKYDGDYLKIEFRSPNSRHCTVLVLLVL